MLEFHRNERARQLRPSLSRSWLLVRPNSAEKDFEEAFASEADSIILDLEDGCPEDEKDEARSRVVKMLNSGVVAWVRINAITTEHWWKDVKALKNTKGLRGVMLATAEHATDIDRTASELPAGTPIIALIESALGVHNAVEIASAIGTFRIAFGAGDYRRDTGSSDTPMALAYVRSQLVIASTLGGIPGPIDGPSVGKYKAENSLLTPIRQTPSTRHSRRVTTKSPRRTKCLTCPSTDHTTAHICRVTCAPRRSKNSPKSTGCGERPKATPSAPTSKVLVYKREPRILPQVRMRSSRVLYTVQLRREQLVVRSPAAGKGIGAHIGGHNPQHDGDGNNGVFTENPSIKEPQRTTWYQQKHEYQPKTLGLFFMTHDAPLEVQTKR